MKMALPVGAVALAIGIPSAATAACTTTGFFRDSINMTAALINPPGQVSGDIDATGCNIGIYYSAGSRGRVDQANVHGANYFGIVNNGASVDISNSTISDIGERPFNGTQHGVGIYFVFGSSASGDIRQNTIWDYQKGGIVVNGPGSKSNIQGNSVIGLGPVDFIAQNGIQVGFGAAGINVQNNFVSGNSYTGPNLAASAGILVYGDNVDGDVPTTQTQVQQNTGIANDIGVWIQNIDAGGNSVTTPTKNTAKNNSLVNNAVNNTTGDVTKGYQAGIADQGTGDTIQGNYICGSGYRDDPDGVTAALFSIDVTAANNATVKNNTVCSGPLTPVATSPVRKMLALSAARGRSAGAVK